MDASDTNYSDWYSWIGKRVCAKNNLYGALRYFGNTHFSDGLWCGIELDSPLGKNDGMVNNVKYFTCNSNFGIFVPVSKVTKLKESSEGNFETKSNETFKIDSSLEKQEFESNSVIVDGLTYKNLKTEDKKLSSSGLGSTESLGILSLYLIEGDNSWDDFEQNCSLDKVFPNFQNARENNISSLESAAVSEDNNLYDTIANPKYASTPRVPRKKLANSENYSDDSLDAKNNFIDNISFDTHCQGAAEFFFDFDKFKNSPNLTSTYKNFSELTAILNNPEVSPILLENKNIKLSVNLEETKDFSKKEKCSQNNNEILSKTFDLHNSACSPISCGKEYENIFNNKDELNVTTIIEDINSKNSNNLEVIFNEKLDLFSKKLNADATFELQCTMNASLKLSLEEIKDLTFELKEKETKHLDESDAINKNVLNATSVIENLKSIDFNGNATFELESPQVLEEIPEENLSSNFNECNVMTDVTNKNKLFLEKTFVFDLSTVNECEAIESENESFNYKSEFLKETDDLQKSSTELNYRNSICLPPSFCNELQKSARRSSSVSNYPSHNPIKDTEHRSFSNRSSISSLKDLRGKTNVFKKPFSPNTTLKNSKSHSSINAKENRNRAFNKEDTNFPKTLSYRNTNSKTSVNTECNKNEVAFKSKLIKPSFHKSEFSKPKVCNLKNLSSSKTSYPALPLKNKLNCDNFKQPSCIASKINSKAMSVDKIVKNSITQTSAITTKSVRENSVKDHVKNSKSLLKMQSLDITFTSKSDSHDSSKKSTSDSKDSLQKSKTDSKDSLQKSKTDSQNSLRKSNFPTSGLGLPKIPKGNSLLPSFKNKLPVGVIKPRYSMLQPKKNAILENVEIERSSQTSEVTEKKLAEINKSLKECSEVNSSESCSNRRQSIVLPKKIIHQSHSQSNQKPGLKQPLKKGGIPTGLKIPRFSQNIKKSS